MLKDILFANFQYFFRFSCSSGATIIVYRRCSYDSAERKVHDIKLKFNRNSYEFRICDSWVTPNILSLHKWNSIVAVYTSEIIPSHWRWSNSSNSIKTIENFINNQNRLAAFCFYFQRSIELLWTNLALSAGHKSRNKAHWHSTTSVGWEVILSFITFYFIYFQ